MAKKAKSYLGMTIGKNGKIQWKGLSDDEIAAQVAADVNPAYDTQISALDSQYNGLVGAGGQFDLENQGILNTYNSDVLGTNETYTDLANQKHSEILSQGNARSSYSKNVQDLVESERLAAQGELEAKKTNSLNDWTTRKNNATTEYQGALSSLNAGKASDALKRKREIEDEQRNKWLQVQQYNSSR